MGAFAVFNANAEGVILSDTSIEEEEEFVAPTTNTHSQQRSGNYVQQQFNPGIKNVLSNDTTFCSIIFVLF